MTTKYFDKEKLRWERDDSGLVGRHIIGYGDDGSDGEYIRLDDGRRPYLDEPGIWTNTGLIPKEVR